MSSSTCIRRFSRLSLDRTAHPPIASRSLLATPQTSCFSTTAAQHASAQGKKGMAAAPKRGARTLNIKKNKKDAAVAKKPAPGERKAARKRIVLSNNNALEVETLTDMDKSTALANKHEGQVKGIPDAVVDALRAVEAFKRSQGWSMFRRPATLIRKETTQLAELMSQAEGGEEGKPKTVRRILTGERLNGKSTLLLQGLTMAFLRQWVVINIPDAMDIVNAHTEYAPLPGSQPTQYSQETYTATLLSQIAKANDKVLSSLTVTAAPNIPVPFPAKGSLKQLAEAGVANPEASWSVFVALWNELTQPGRPPIMFALDNLAHIMRNSDYLSADVKPIHAHDLTLISHFVTYLSGSKLLPNGGVVLASTSKSNTPTVSALDFSLEVAEAKQYSPNNMPQWNPYKKADQRVIDCLKDIKVLKIAGLSKNEARSIIEYYAASGMLRAKVDDGFVTEKWSLAGMGNIGELERASVRLRL
ncbi:hypothetical protein P154DRAFT_444116 [Amniculicola lignicola CBS 123094]|uniref:Small ribosomal subunit protein mS29 n=1 Tax=Amniculicola lignicola CBS 123094 TaxID=1392246 RepID=A0A6A5W5J3_9PLEO|nr:hypothetical protein P154DRAFT_444116 [Amniculicola lignicola CBS 123094]